jgi:hypothetical protein
MVLLLDVFVPVSIGDGLPLCLGVLVAGLELLKVPFDFSIFLAFLARTEGSASFRRCWAAARSSAVLSWSWRSEAAVGVALI